MKYFAVSDIHGYYDELIEVLKNVGYNSEDDNCKLIVCGDMFDRGKNSLHVYKLLRRLHEKE